MGEYKGAFFLNRLRICKSNQMETEKQKNIRFYFENQKKMQEYFSFDVNSFTKSEKKFLRYKFACIDSYPNCSEIPKHKKTSDFEACQVRCKYSYE